MSDQRPEIQRYDLATTQPAFGAAYGCLIANASGALMYHSDHLRHLTLAKIAVLESLDPKWVEAIQDDVVYYDTIEAKIAALRKEMENG